MADTKEIIAAGQVSGVVHCLTIPLKNETALLPNSAIAEVISFREPAPVEDAPEWFLGYIEWRDKRVPLISFESISNQISSTAKKNSRVCVLNTLNGNAELPYIGILTQGIPSLAIVQEQGLEEKENFAEERLAIAAIVEVGGVEAVIPDIDDIEQRLVRLNV